MAELSSTSALSSLVLASLGVQHSPARCPVRTRGCAL